jgi:hypothetical protein
MKIMHEAKERHGNWSGNVKEVKSRKAIKVEVPEE